MNYDQLADSVIQIGQIRGGTYSNSQIKMLCEESQIKKGGKVSQEDLVKYLKEEMVGSGSSPAIDKDMKNQFDEDFKKFMA